VPAVCVATLAALAVGPRPAHACDNRFPWTCESAPAAAPEEAPAATRATRTRPPATQNKAQKRAAPRAQREPQRANRRAVSREAAGQPDRRGAATAKPGTASAPALPPAAAEAEARYDAGDAMPDPGGTSVSNPVPAAHEQESATAAPDPDAAPIVIVSHAELNEIDRAAHPPPQTTDQTWLARLLAALGGAFAAASVLRFLAG
jgi:hypothetical protein